ncbi:CPBP family glutamic-type intramembrane protease [Tepidimicrobium xylanilyticum]
MLKNGNRPSILGTNVLFLISALLLLTLGAKVQHRELYSGLIITEFIIILLPTLLYIKLGGHSIAEVLRLNSISFLQFIYIIFIVIFAYPIAVFLNYISIMIISRFGQVIPSSVPIPSNYQEFIKSFLVIALSPGICEEAMFRGLIMNSYENMGKKKALVYSAILFGMFHFNSQNLLGPIFLGIIFGIVVFKTDSILSAIIGHTLNNTIALALGYGLNRFGGYNQNFDGVNLAMPEMDLMLYGIIIMGIFALVFGILLIKLINSLPSRKTISIGFSNGYNNLFVNTIRRARMNIWERIPIWIFITVFIVWNYIVFFS